MKLAIIAQLLIVCQFALNASGSAYEETTTPSTEIARIVAIRDEDEYIEAVRKAAIKQWQAVEQIRKKSLYTIRSEFDEAIIDSHKGVIKYSHPEEKDVVKGRYTVEYSYLQAVYFLRPIHKSEMMKVLIELGANINEVTTIPHYSAPTILSNACHNQDLEIIELLLQSGANVNLIDFKGRTAMHYAYIAGGNHEVINLLKLHGADETIVDRYGKRPADYTKIDFNSMGVDADLHESFLKAVRDCNRDEIIKLHSKDKRLVEIDACKDKTLLSYAYGWTSNKHIIELLIKLGANPNRKSTLGELYHIPEYPLVTQVCKEGDIEVAELLVQLGANVKYKNIDDTGIILDIHANNGPYRHHLHYDSLFILWLKDNGVSLYEKDIFEYFPIDYRLPKWQRKYLSLYGDPKSKTKVKID